MIKPINTKKPNKTNYHVAAVSESKSCVIVCPSLNVGGCFGNAHRTVSSSEEATVVQLLVEWRSSASHTDVANHECVSHPSSQCCRAFITSHWLFQCRFTPPRSHLVNSLGRSFYTPLAAGQSRFKSSRLRPAARLLFTLRPRFPLSKRAFCVQMHALKSFRMMGSEND